MSSTCTFTLKVHTKEPRCILKPNPNCKIYQFVYQPTGTGTIISTNTGQQANVPSGPLDNV